MKIGLFFGSFNPVHCGHMVIAGYMSEFTDLNQVWFVVSPHNPLKVKSSLLQDYHRMTLVKTAIGDNRKLKATDIEFKLPQPSYTINTLVYLKEKHPEMFRVDIAPEADVNLRDIVVVMDRMRKNPNERKVAFVDPKDNQKVETDLMYPNILFSNVIGN